MPSADVLTQSKSRERSAADGLDRVFQTLHRQARRKSNHTPQVSSSSNAFVALRSAVSKPSVNQPKAGQVAGGAEFERPGALCAGDRYGPREAGFDLSGRCTLHLLELPLDAVE